MGTHSSKLICVISDLSDFLSELLLTFSAKVDLIYNLKNSLIFHFFSGNFLKSYFTLKIL